MDPSAAREIPRLFTPQFNMLLAANLFIWIGFGSFFLFPLFILDIGGTKADIGILMGVMPFAAVVVRPWASEMVDRLGRRIVMAAGGGIMGAAGFACLFFQDPIASVFYAHLTLRFFFGVGFSFLIVASFTLAADLSPRLRLNEGIGVFGTTGLLGVAMGPMSGEWMIQQFGFSALFIATGMNFALGVLLTLAMKADPADRSGRRIGSFMETLRLPVVFWIALIGLCFGIGFAAHGSFVAPYAKSKAMYASFYYGAYSGAAIVARLIGGKISDRLGESGTIPVAMGSAGVGFALLIFIDSPFGLAVSGFFCGIGHGLIVPALLASTVRDIPAHGRGKATGVITGGLDSGLFLGAVILGYVGDAFGYPALFTTAVMSMCIGLAVWLFRRSVSTPK
jgi:MFS family permease